jgi:hypothetical protein
MPGLPPFGVTPRSGQEQSVDQRSSIFCTNNRSVVLLELELIVEPIHHEVAEFPGAAARDRARRHPLPKAIDAHAIVPRPVRFVGSSHS